MRIAVLLLLAASALAGDLDELLDGVESVGTVGVPGPLCVFGPDAFVVVAGKSGKHRAPLVAATRWGKGRVVVFGHGGYLKSEPRLVANAVKWAGGGRVATDLRRIGDCDVLVVDTHRIRAQRAAVAAFVKAGGGLVTAGLKWGWDQLNPGMEHPGNLLLAEAGICFAGGYVREPTFDVAGLHAGKALAGKLDAQAVWTLTEAARTLPAADTILLPKLREFADRAVTFPVKKPRDRLALTMQLLRREAAHPAAAHFPGAVDAPVVEKKLTIETVVPGWHSTGLYAAPGARLEVDLPEELGVRIGAHKDQLWHKPAWRRAPSISRRGTVNPFGGLVYIEVPRKCKLGRVDVTIRGAVAAPHFVRGATTNEEWKTIRGRKAPWAELQGHNVILTVPSRVVRKLDDPAALMAFWDEVLDHCADLAQRPRQRERPERFVADLQISAGYMHSGYPIMTHLDAADRMVDLARMKKGEWGMFHELGHNHQHSDWTFGGTVEVTCNLFTLYVFEKACGVPVSAHKNLRREQQVRQYDAGGRKFEVWKRKPFLALIMYVELQEAFGWEAFQQVFREYRELPRPKTDAEKRDQWLIRFSRAVNRNLGPFFQRWGVPTSEAARAAIADLPAWERVAIRGIYGGEPAAETIKAGRINAVWIGERGINKERVKRLKDQGVKVFAEFNTLHRAEYLKEHPDAAPVGPDGEVAPAPHGWQGICPTHPEYRKWRMDAFRKLLTDHDLDGVWLDYHHAHASWERAEPVLPDTCHCARCRKQAAGQDWVAWRCGVFVDWVREFKVIRDTVRPKALLGTFHCPWSDDARLKEKLAIDLRAQAKYIDVFSPMPYHARFGHAKDPAWISRQTAWLGKHLGRDARIWPIVQLADWGEAVPVEQIAAVLDHGSREPATGVMVFAWGRLRKRPDKVAALARFFRAHR